METPPPATESEPKGTGGKNDGGKETKPRVARAAILSAFFGVLTIWAGFFGNLSSKPWLIVVSILLMVSSTILGLCTRLLLRNLNRPKKEYNRVCAGIILIGLICGVTRIVMELNRQPPPLPPPPQFPIISLDREKSPEPTKPFRTPFNFINHGPGSISNAQLRAWWHEPTGIMNHSEIECVFTNFPFEIKPGRKLTIGIHGWPGMSTDLADGTKLTFQVIYNVEIDKFPRTNRYGFQLSKEKDGTSAWYDRDEGETMEQIEEEIRKLGPITNVFQMIPVVGIEQFWFEKIPPYSNFVSAVRIHCNVQNWSAVEAANIHIDWNIQPINAPFEFDVINPKSITNEPFFAMMGSKSTLSNERDFGTRSANDLYQNLTNGLNKFTATVSYCDFYHHYFIETLVFYPTNGGQCETEYVGSFSDLWPGNINARK